MIQFEVNNKTFLCIEKWQQMPLNKAVQLHTLCKNEMPENLKHFYNILILPNDMMQVELDKYYEELTEEKSKENQIFYGKALVVLSNIDADTCEKVLPSFRVNFYKEYIEKFVFGLLNYPYDYAVQKIESFMHEGVEYYLPETKNVLGTEKPFFDRTAIEFTEAADLEMYGKQLAGGKYEVAANLIAIMCRPKVGGKLEPYNEAKCMAIAKQFESVTMDKVFEVFFCLQEHIDLSNQHIQLYIQEQTIKQVNPLRVVV